MRFFWLIDVAATRLNKLCRMERNEHAKSTAEPIARPHRNQFGTAARIKKMKRRYLEFVGLTCLLIYVGIVALGQVAHSIPGWACSCHKSNSQLKLVTSGPTEAVTQQSQSLGWATSDHATEESVCLMCYWFSMAKHPISVTQFSSDDSSITVHGLPACKAYRHLASGILPRGPPRNIAV